MFRGYVEDGCVPSLNVRNGIDMRHDKSFVNPYLGLAGVSNKEQGFHPALKAVYRRFFGVVAGLDKFGPEAQGDFRAEGKIRFSAYELSDFRFNYSEVSTACIYFR